MKRATKLLALVLALNIVLCGCGKAEPKTVTNNGLSMTIAGNMEAQSETQGYTFLYTNNKEAVIGLMEEKALFEELGYYLTLEEYLQLVLENNNMSGGAWVENGLYLFSHESIVDGVSYSYLNSVYENEDAFWLIQCSSRTADFDDYYDTFMQYLESVIP